MVTDKTFLSRSVSCRRQFPGGAGAASLALMHALTRIRGAAYSMMLASAWALSVPLPAYAQGDAAAGEQVFAHCVVCHSNKPGENKFGPSLAGAFGRKSGTEPGYNYSPAMKGLNVTWDETTLDEYLQGPGKFVRGTKMVYMVPNEKDRQDVIAYLKTLPK
jgi:cytochrome c